MTNDSLIQREIKAKGQKLSTVTNFRYPVAVVSVDDSKRKVKDCTRHCSSNRDETYF